MLELVSNINEAHISDAHRNHLEKKKNNEYIWNSISRLWLAFASSTKLLRDWGISDLFAHKFIEDIAIPDFNFSL